jgi:FKBP-type peptidyl-prolyl cis-trans isomerase 2
MREDMNGFLEPGMLVRHPNRDDWGLGQVQSVTGSRVTVNFEHAGKVVIDSNRIDLVLQFDDFRP